MAASTIPFFRSWLGASLVLFAFSERVFWSFWRADDSAQELGITFLAYSLVAAWAIHAIRIFRVSSADGFFLIGALVGWLSEGVLVNTAYGDATNPFPLSISFTGLSWHALISVMVGWYWLPRAFAAGSTSLVLKWTAGLGACWGLWACYVPTESPKHSITIQAFASHSLFVTAMVAAGTALMSHAPVENRKFDQAKYWTISSAAIAVFALAWIPLHQAFAIVLLLLFLLTVYALRISRGAFELQTWVPKVDVRQVGWLALTFGIAVSVYALGTQGGKGLPTNFVLYVLTVPAGFYFWTRGIVRAFRSTPMVPPAVHSGSR